MIFLHYTDEKNNNEENGHEEVDDGETDFNEYNDKENDNDDHLSASSEGFKKAVAL